MPLQTLPPAGVTDRPWAKICGALPDRQIQPFDKHVFNVEEFSDCSLSSNRPFLPDHCASLYLHDAIVPTRLDDIDIEPQHPSGETEQKTEPYLNLVYVFRSALAFDCHSS